MDYRSGVEGLVVSGRGPVGASSSGSKGDGSDEHSVLPLRDLERGKGPAVIEETPREVPGEPAEFIPPVGTSRHDLISKSDLVEFVGEDALARLMEENLTNALIIDSTDRKPLND
ncbi:hypothetical protein RHMOL_Rhmol04G0193300 [Rhododendron molle]|uniref:Uncharacterized protein n=1 Tax=Rhododendron molle TaxID=49168 RepID=A0ACC0P224_RHOML|nr:hypothetical protein RHMOL_Rhmol04G0193300 [Rhododendron molle]